LQHVLCPYSYLTKNTLSLHQKEQSVYAIQGNYCCLLGAFDKLRKASSRPSVCPHGTTLLLKGKAVSTVTGLEWPRGFQEVKVPRFHDNGTGWW
jgi:hypothetical protein